MTISVEDRFGAIEACAYKFGDHLTQNPGAVLPPALRLAVVHYAREAAFCTADASKLPQEACLKPGTSVYDVIEKIEHATEYQNEAVPVTVKNVLLTIVHSVVNHQGRLDQGWYDSSIQAILTTDGILPSKEEDENKKQPLAYVAFSEILVLAATSHSLNLAFFIMGRPLPPLPTMDEMKLMEPMLLDWTALLKTAPRHNSKAWFAHFNYAGDYNKKSSGFKRISKEAWAVMKDMMDPMVMDPRLPAAYATNDTVFWDQFKEVCYVPNKVS